MEGEPIQYTQTHAKHTDAWPQFHLSEGSEIRQFHLFQHSAMTAATSTSIYL